MPSLRSKQISWSERTSELVAEAQHVARGLGVELNGLAPTIRWALETAIRWAREEAQRREEASDR
jgi:hypothetical protein